MLLGLGDATSDDGWLKTNSKDAAIAYRDVIGRLPHVVVPRTVYEGVEDLCCLVAYRPIVVSDAFCALAPKGEVSN